MLTQTPAQQITRLKEVSIFLNDNKYSVINVVFTLAGGAVAYFSPLAGSVTSTAGYIITIGGFLNENKQLMIEKNLQVQIRRIRRNTYNAKYGQAILSQNVAEVLDSNGFGSKNYRSWVIGFGALQFISSALLSVDQKVDFIPDYGTYIISFVSISLGVITTGFQNLATSKVKKYTEMILEEIRNLDNYDKTQIKKADDAALVSAEQKIQTAEIGRATAVQREQNAENELAAAVQRERAAEIGRARAQQTAQRLEAERTIAEHTAQYDAARAAAAETQLKQQADLMDNLRLAAQHAAPTQVQSTGIQASLRDFYNRIYKTMTDYFPNRFSFFTTRQQPINQGRRLSDRPEEIELVGVEEVKEVEEGLRRRPSNNNV
jgi:hypothetical protein